MRTEKEKLQREIIDALYDKYNNKEYCINYWEYFKFFLFLFVN